MFIKNSDNYVFVCKDDTRHHVVYNAIAYKNSSDIFCVIVDLYAIHNRMNPIDNVEFLNNLKPYIPADRTCKLIIDSSYEAPSYEWHLKPFMDAVTEVLGIHLQDQLLLSAARHQDNHPVNFVVSDQATINQVVLEGDYVDHVPIKHFLSLSRIAKPHRIISTVEMFDRKLDQYGHITLASGYYNNPVENSSLRYFVPERYNHLFPLYLDGHIIPGDKDHDQHRMSDTRMVDCFCNVVQETSYDRNICSLSWNLPLISEKSTKPFAWGQVPLFIAPATHVRSLREFHFHLFDDIIDHSYDTEPDGLTRIKLVIDQLEKICSQPIGHWQDYKKQNIDRFRQNRVKAQELFNTKYSGIPEIYKFLHL
jgi:hypothetical protein